MLDPEIRREFAAIYPAVAEAAGLPMIPHFCGPLWEKAERIQSDGIHPTAEGYAAITAHVMPRLMAAMGWGGAGVV